MTDSEIRALIEQEVTAQLQAMNTKDIASETDIPTLSDAEWDTNNSLTSMPVVYNGSTWRKIGLSFLRTLRNAAAVINTAWNSLTNNGTNVTWIPTVNSSGVAGKSSPADLASVLGVAKSVHSNNGSGFMAWGGDGLYLFGGYSTDLTEYSCYIGTYKSGVYAPTSISHRLDDGDKCVLDSNTSGTLAIHNPTADKSYQYYFLRIGV